MYQPWQTYAAIAILALIGCALVVYSSSVAPWGYSDSAEYIGSARSLLAGHGLGTFGASGDFSPMTLHPPFYPLVLGFLGLFTSDLITAAGWLNVFLFGIVIAAVGAISFRITCSSWLALILASITLLAPGMVYAYTGIMSESLHHTLAVISLFLLALYLHSGEMWAFVLAAVLAGLALATRYLGLAVPLAGAAGILVFGRGHFGRKLLHAVIFGAVGVLPLGLWLVMNRLMNGVSARQPSFTGVNLWERAQPFRLMLVETFYKMIPVLGKIEAPGGYNQMKATLTAFCVVFIGLIALLIWKVVRDRHNTETVVSGMRFASVFALFTAVYAVIYLLAFVYNNPQPDLIDRIYFPVYLSGIFTIFLSFWMFAQAFGSKRIIPMLAVILGFMYSISYLQVDIAYARQLHQTGDGYTGLNWKDSPTLALVRELPESVPLVSNESSVIHLLLERRTYGITEIISHTPSQPFTRFGERDDDAERAFRYEGAALVLFSSARWQFAALYPGMGEERTTILVEGLYLYRETSDGAIYFFEKPAWVGEDLP